MERKRRVKNLGGRPTGPKLPCGACGKELTATEWRTHFTTCPKRPKEPKTK